MNCDTCKERTASMMPRTAHESDMARMERVIRWIASIMILLIAYCGVMTYLYIDAATSFETQEATVEVDTGDGDAVVAGIGDVYYGENPSYSQETTP